MEIRGSYRCPPTQFPTNYYTSLDSGFWLIARIYSIQYTGVLWYYGMVLWYYGTMVLCINDLNSSLGREWKNVRRKYTYFLFVAEKKVANSGSVQYFNIKKNLFFV